MPLTQYDCLCAHHSGPTGWPRLIGSLKLQIIFCKRATDYKALLRKMTYEDKASPVSAVWQSFAVFGSVLQYIAM